MKTYSVAIVEDHVLLSQAIGGLVDSFDRFKVTHLCKNGKVTLHPIHVLVGIAFIGLRIGTLTYDHKDTNNQNNRADNLRLATKSEQLENRNMFKNNKLGFKNITECVVTGYEYYKIQIKRNGKRVVKCFNKKKYSLEHVIEERDRMSLLM